MYGNGRPITKRQFLRLMVALTILAWATQVLFKQWGYGAVAPQPVDHPVEANQPVEIAGAATPAAPAERFISPRPNAIGVGATLQFLSEASINGPEVRLRQVARWSNRDAAFFAPVADLVVARMDARGPYRVIDLDAVRRTLSDAGVNPALVKFVGPRSCAVNRADSNVEPEAALAKWLDAAQSPVAVTTPAAPAQSAVAGASVVGATAQSREAETRGAVRTLREVLTDDLADRLQVPVEALQLRFNPKDDRILSLCEPQFKFFLESNRGRNLGEVSWNLTMTASDAPAGKPQRLAITASARLWQQQVVVKRPIPLHSTIRAEDVEERRSLLEIMPADQPLALDRVVGQQSARALQPGMVMTGRMIEAVQLARQGQLLTVSLNLGGVHVKSVAKSLESGSLGQRVKARNEVTNEVYDVVLTGPQEGVIGGR